MPTSGASTVHYRAVIADLRADRGRLSNELDELRQKLKAKEQAVADLDRTISQLEFRAGDDDSEPRAPDAQDSLAAAVQVQSPVTGLLALGLGDACVAAIRALGNKATNQQILAYLTSVGYEIKSTNPLNNVGTGLNHRSKNRGDIVRIGRDWVISTRKEEVAERAELNGASVVQ